MIRELSEGQFPEAAALAAAAFREDPGFVHILPDDALRRFRLPSLLEALLRVDARAGGRVCGAFDEGALVGVSSVIPAGVGSPDIPDWIKHLPSLAWLAAQPAALLRGLALHRSVEDLRVKDCDYLRLLGVHPATQGRGIGAALINDAVKKAGRPLYLETFTESNRAFYEARGFKFLMEVRSPERPTFWTMRRG